jgi:predicted ATPase/class 3 adenylate cyclase
MSKLPRGKVTLLFTDVEGSTRLLDELGAEGYATALAAHRRIVRAAFDRHAGIEIDTQGDAFFAAFADPTLALTAAAEIRDALGNGPIRLRMGLHTGEPVLTEEGYVGPDVHKAARIAAAGHGGQVVVSAETREASDADRIGALIPLGTHRLKDLGDPIPLYQLGDQDFPPLRSLNQSNLPDLPGSFVGREAELADLVGRLRPGADRLVTLSGPGGSGKTRLAVEAAARVVPAYEHGVWWVPLAALRDADLLFETIGSALGAKTDLSEHLEGKRTLLVLDNFEQLMDAAPRLAELMSTCRDLHLLVTSREALRLRGEQTLHVQPLAEPAAIELFIDRARAQRPGFVPVDAVAGICRRLDRLPLAVELAAARVTVLTAAQILTRLEHRLPLPASGARDAPDRQKTLRATIAWSYELLTADEQRVFRNLSVFVGGWMLDAAEEVAAADLDLLESLVDKSLVRFTDGRYGMLETIREFAADEQAADSPALSELKTRHRRHFVALAEEQNKAIGFEGEAAALARLEADNGNLGAALADAQRADEPGDEARLVIALIPFWTERGLLREVMSAADHATERRMGLHEALRARLLRRVTWTEMHRRGWARIRELSGEALAINRALGDASGVGYSLNHLAIAVNEEGDRAQARALWAEAIATFRAADDRDGLTKPLENLAVEDIEDGNYPAAKVALHEVLGIEESFGDRTGMSHVLNNLAMVALNEGDARQALQLTQRALALQDAVGSRAEAPPFLDNAAAAYIALGDVDRALALAGAADALRTEFGAQRDSYEEGTLARILSEAARTLSPEAIEAGLAAGRALGYDAALRLANGEPERAGPQP